MQATNVAELSLTIEDVVHVVETGRVKEHTYTPVSVIYPNLMSR